MNTPDEEIDQSLFPSQAEASEAENLWKQGQDEAAKGQPEGQFNVIVKKADLGRSNSSGRLQIHYELQVASGEAAGTTLHKYDGMGTAKQAAITQQQLARIGVDVKATTMATLPAVLATLVGKTLAVTGKKNGDFYNIYFNKAVTTDVGGDGASGDSNPFG